MALVTLKTLKIKNFGPIIQDEIDLSDFTFFIGRNNAGKSHYVSAIEFLLATKAPSVSEIAKLQHDPESIIEIEGIFAGVEAFTELIKVSNHRDTVLKNIDDSGNITVVRRLSTRSEETVFGIKMPNGEIHNPGGLTTNLLKVLPEVISIPATADTIDELKNTQSTALSKLKREVLSVFFEELKQKTQTTLTELDAFLHSTEPGQRSDRLVEFEQNLKEELTGEFADVVPSVEFGLPDQDIIAKEMKIFLDDGYRSEVEQKGNGLQRATLLALLKVLAKYGDRYHDKPTPIFLIGELESFLHPYAQMQFGRILLDLVGQYQVITTTHSPFIINEKSLAGYRRVSKTSTDGTKATAARVEDLDVNKVQRSLGLRGNLEGLFADRVILLEGPHDQACYERLIDIFGIEPPPGKLVIFSFVEGKGSLWPTQKFYSQLGLDDASIIADLDYLFSDTIKPLLSAKNVSDDTPQKLRKHIHCTGTSPSLETVLNGIESYSRPVLLDKTIRELKEKRVFIIKGGSPEKYYTAGENKDGWRAIQSEVDLKESAYLKELLKTVFASR